MCRQTKIIEIDGRDILVAYRKTAMGILLKKTTDADTGKTMWLNLNQQEQAKSELR